MKLPLREYYQLLSKYLRPQRQKVLLLALFLFSGIGLQLYTPQIVRRFIDAAQAGAPVEALTQMGLLFLTVTIVQLIVRTGAAFVTEDVKWRATNWLRNDLSDHCLNLDMSFHNDNTPGTMIERIDGDVKELSNFFSQFVLKVMGNGILLIGVIILLFLEEWRIGVAYTGFALFMFLSLGKIVSFGVPFWDERREASSKMFGLIEEWLGGTEDIRANGGSPYVMHRLHQAIFRLHLGTRKAFLAGSSIWGMNKVYSGLSTAIALGLGAYLWQGDVITLGTVYLALHYSNLLQHPLEELARELKDLQAATASIMRIRQLFEVETKIQEMPQPLALPQGAQSVTFDGVTFGYATDEPILHDISFDLEPGKVLGLLGRTGSGKTTITRLLFRLYDPTQGAVCLSGKDLRNVSFNEVRRSVGMVTQDVQLFRASVRDNLTFFDPSISDERIVEALEILGLDQWYGSLERGLDTPLAAGGRGLSAGEAQLLAFTRVFLKDPGLVILDEASSRLDPVTEQLIERAIDRLLHNRTAIIVAHRLTTVQRADEIMILRDGHILEHDDRVALIAKPDSHFSQLLQVGMAEVLV